METSASDTRFTAIGTSGSGKTCYLLGLFDTMAIGVNGFALTTTNETAAKLEEWCDTLDNEVGTKRFPSGTALNEVSDYGFTLAYKGRRIETIDWMDYGGGILRDKGRTLPEIFQQLKTSIETSAAMYIFIDGTLLCTPETEEKIRNVSQKCARNVNGFIQDFANAHDECFPPIIFIITKSDLCGQYVKEGELQQIISQCFSPVLTDTSTVYITAVSLGENISEECNGIEYAGASSPINMQIPFFLGLYHDYLDFYAIAKKQIDGKIDEYKCEISKNHSEIQNNENNPWNWLWFVGDKTRERTSYCESKISELKSKIAKRVEILASYRLLLKAVSMQLLRDSNYFITIKGGHEAPFEPIDI